LQNVGKPSEKLSKSWEARVMELLSGNNGESTFNGEWPYKEWVDEEYSEEEADNESSKDELNVQQKLGS